jgi:uncharacterized membrane protein
MSTLLDKLNPSVERRFLILIAGGLWLIVGIMLCSLASQWLTNTPGGEALMLGLSGIVLSLFIYHFGFMKLVKKNAGRIIDMKGKRCVFAFQPWRSYLVVIIMILLGVTLRHSRLSRNILAIIYTGFGLAMILSSLKYFWIYMKHVGKI